MSPKELKKRMKEADFTAVERYMRMFDRILLYNLAAHTMPEDFLQSAVRLWDKAVKMGIDQESSYRTAILQSTIMGRRAKYAQAPDGEQVRLDALKQYGIARDIIMSNLHQDNPDDDEYPELDFDPEDFIDEDEEDEPSENPFDDTDSD